VHATLVGRFFSGELIHAPGGTHWGGYGHFGCCSLFAIQQVLSVDPQDRTDLDYRTELDWALPRDGCEDNALMKGADVHPLVEQRRAEAEVDSAAFHDALSFATFSFARLLKIEPQKITGMTTKATSGRATFQWQSSEPGKQYSIVVSRPYELVFYAKDPTKIAWVVLDAYQTICK
jgi:hypothetical protein